MKTEYAAARAALPGPDGLRRIRENAGASRPEWAAMLSCSPQAVALWERGETRPSGQLALRLVRLLRMLGELE